MPTPRGAAAPYRWHTERNVLDHLPERDRPAVKRRLRAAWKLTAHEAAIERLEALALELAHSHPAAASLREGLAKTVTLQRLGVDQQLWRSLASTNPIESMIAICRATSRNVKRWQNGDMCLRWTAAGMLEAETEFRKIIGYKHLAHLALAVERDVAARRAATSRSTTSPTDNENTTETAATLARHLTTGPPPPSSTANGTTSACCRLDLGHVGLAERRRRQTFGGFSPGRGRNARAPRRGVDGGPRAARTRRETPPVGRREGLPCRSEIYPDGSSISVQHWFLRDAARPQSQEALNRALTRLDRISEPDEVPTRGRFNRRHEGCSQSPRRGGRRGHVTLDDLAREGARSAGDGLQAADRRPRALAQVQGARARRRLLDDVKFNDGIGVIKDDTHTAPTTR